MAQKAYSSPAVGQHIVCTFVLPREYLVDHRQLIEVATKVLQEFGYGIFGVTVGYFNEKRQCDGETGYTAVLTLSESHASFHTYPEHKSIIDDTLCGTVAFDLYTCRSDDDDAAWEVFTPLRKLLEEQFQARVLAGTLMSFPRLVKPHE
jgi:S-adenosylmethionine/arginine decarboxylase-like enzyme